MGKKIIYTISVKTNIQQSPPPLHVPVCAPGHNIEEYIAIFSEQTPLFKVQTLMEKLTEWVSGPFPPLALVPFKNLTKQNNNY